jgi:hypothetical protein
VPEPEPEPDPEVHLEMLAMQMGLAVKLNRLTHGSKVADAQRDTWLMQTRLTLTDAFKTMLPPPKGAVMFTVLLAVMHN